MKLRSLASVEAAIRAERRVIYETQLTIGDTDVDAIVEYTNRIGFGVEIHGVWVSPIGQGWGTGYFPLPACLIPHNHLEEQIPCAN